MSISQSASTLVFASSSKSASSKPVDLTSSNKPPAKRQKKSAPVIIDLDTWVSSKPEKAVESEAEAKVTFLVGPAQEPVKFVVHKTIMVSASPVFQAAFNSRFMEGQSQSYKLEDTTPQAFRLFTQWCYKRENLIMWGLPNTETQKTSQTSLKYFHSQYVEEAKTSSWSVAYKMMVLAEAWILGDKFLIPRFQNQTMRALQILFYEGYAWLTISEDLMNCLAMVYNETSSESPLRKCFAERFAWALYENAGMFGELFGKYEEQFRKEMLAGVLGL